ncbi:MAG: division/cell wall cluster transcriptional repressor MraZ [Ruminococcaceae bacterium]|nr:division/cell wall cluster transcriptional repressor MraZ [Oscillospiraceae bacterium]MBQ7397887.1 division/cell wall cluster transcriptional repressor MraZ [Clostridia bacterium]
MLTGEFRHSLDAKNRIFMPAKLREELGETFIIARDIREKCLKVYSMEGWAAYTAPIKEKPRQLAEQIMRLLHRSAAQVTPDSQGRVLLPPMLVEYAGIEKNAVVVGCEEYAEIWSEANYQTMLDNVDDEALRQALESWGL